MAFWAKKRRARAQSPEPFSVPISQNPKRKKHDKNILDLIGFTHEEIHYFDLLYASAASRGSLAARRQGKVRDLLDGHLVYVELSD